MSVCVLPAFGAILANTSVWIDHVRNSDPNLALRLFEVGIACHPFVVAEIALGSLKDRRTILGLLDQLPRLLVTDPEEVRTLIDRRHLFGCGMGHVALIASCLLAPGTRLWTRDRRLGAAAAATEIAAADP